MLRLACLLLCWTLSTASQAQGFDPTHAQWNALLSRHVQWTGDGHASVVDYAGFERDRAPLQAYLDSLSALSPDAFNGLSRSDRLAFLINAYNAFTVALVLQGWPEIESIKDLGSLWRSPWKQRFFTLLGESRHLDDVEHALIRGNPELNDPRIHFAVNCASIGCPALRPEAYAGARLDAQLDDQTRRFLTDRQRNRIADDALWLSPIFRWYEEDFGPKDAPWDFLRRHAHWLDGRPAQQARIAEAALDIDYTDYDWSLNATPR